MTDKFYRLTHDEWLKSQSLKPAERDLLFYLKTLDPFGDGVELAISAIADNLGRNKSTISRALKVLANGGWIDLELVKVKIKINCSGCVQTTPLRTDNPDSCTQPPIPTDNERFLYATADSCTQPPIPTDNDRPPEPAPGANSAPPKTNKTYSDFLKTLSDSQRESFKKFVMKKVMDAPFEIASPQAWNDKHWPEYWAEFETKYPIVANIDGEGKIPPAEVDEKRNILEAAIAMGTIQNFDRKANGDYLIHIENVWLAWDEWEQWCRGEFDMEAHKAKRAATRAKLQQYMGGESCR